VWWSGYTGVVHHNGQGRILDSEGDEPSKKAEGQRRKDGKAVVKLTTRI